MGAPMGAPCIMTIVHTIHQIPIQKGCEQYSFELRYAMIPHV